MKQLSRRIALQALAFTPGMLPLGLEAQVHQMRHAQASTKKSGPYKPKVFGPEQYATLCSLCNSIIPSDETSGGAVEAGAPELIDLLASENEDYQTRLTGGIQWLDSTCHDRYGRNYLECSADQRDEILQLIAYRENAQQFPKLSSGIAFFAFLRDLTLGGYFTSEMGMKSLPYLGNQFVPVFPGCPPVPES
jgi:gluconate 2-dehydrogenase gamma chain